MTDNYDKALDSELLFSDNSSQLLSSWWRRKALLLVFLRHFG